MRSKLWCILAIVVCALLPLAGCSGGGESVKQTQKGVEVTVGGKVDVSKATSKVAFLSATSASAANNVFVYNALDGAQLGTAAIGTDGSFSNLSFTLPAAKTVLVFKAIVAQGTFRSVVPLDLSNPPAGGAITDSQPVSIVISQDSTNVASTVSAMLGLTGVLGDTGKTLASVNKTYTDAATQVLNYGGQVLAYSSTGLALSGSVSNTSLLPAKHASTLTFEDLNNVRLAGKIISAYVPGNKAIVNFQVYDKATGKGVSGLTSFGIHIAQLKDGNTWLNYKLEAAGAARDRAFLPGADSGYTIINHGDGNYTAVLGTDLLNNNAYVLSQRDDATKDGEKLIYNADLIHRIGITVSSAAPAKPINPATGATVTSFTPPNVAALVYDFVPDTGLQYVNPNGGNYARDLVTMEACNACHSSLVNHGHHFGSRADTRICVICHTQQNKRTDIAATDMTSFIHKIHMGEELPVHEVVGGIDIGHITYPQDQRNCTTCHKGKDVNNWKTKPSRNACGSCHNDLDFATHKSGQTDDTKCFTCHFENYVIESHTTMVPTPNNPTIPTGADSFSYTITEVAVDGTMHPVIKFKPLKNGAALTFNAYVDTTTEMVTDYTSSPSLYVFYARPQDGITAPVDYNTSSNVALKSVWQSASGNTLTGPVDGVYTATLNSITIPADAVMVNGGIMSNGFARVGAEATFDKDFNGDGDKLDNYNIPYQSVTKVATGYTARRAIVSNAKCNACHEMLGVKPSFHSGARNDAPTCQVCHTPNRANRGWAVNSSSFVHSLHAAAKRTVPYTWHKELDSVTQEVTWTGEHITYPGLLRNCEECHVAGTYDFATTAAQVDDMLYSTVASGTSAYVQADLYRMSPDVETGVIYGAAFNGSNSAAAPVEAAATTLVSSPISAACYSCHDTGIAKAHMVSNGGSIYEARSTALQKKEACLVCHGARTADTTLAVTPAIPTIKAVHRWW